MVGLSVIATNRLPIHQYFHLKFSETLEPWLVKLSFGIFCPSLGILFTVIYHSCKIFEESPSKSSFWLELESFSNVSTIGMKGLELNWYSDFKIMQIELKMNELYHLLCQIKKTLNFVPGVWRPFFGQTPIGSGVGLFLRPTQLRPASALIVTGLIVY